MKSMKLWLMTRHISRTIMTDSGKTKVSCFLLVHAYVETYMFLLHNRTCQGPS